MNDALRVLIVEDQAADAELMARELRSAGVACATRRAANREDFLRELTDFNPQLILADYSLPQFGAMEALRLARKLGPPVPIIVVSGTIDDETAVACLQAGAADYVLKDHLARLPAAVGIAIGSHRARVEQRRAEEAYRTVVDNSLQGLVIFQGLKIVFANRAFADMGGYTVEEILAGAQGFIENAVHPDDRAMVLGRLRARQAGKEVPDRYEFRGFSKDGTVHWLELQAVNVSYQGEPAVMTAFIDVTDRHRAEEALRASEEKCRALFEATREAVALHEVVLGPAGEPFDFTVLEANPAFERALGMPRGTAAGRRGSEIFADGAASRLAGFARTAAPGATHRSEVVAIGSARTFAASVAVAGPGRFTMVLEDLADRGA